MFFLLIEAMAQLQNQPRMGHSLLAVIVGGLIIGLGIGMIPAIAWADTLAIPDSLKQIAQTITEFELDNGMKFVVMERHQAPVVSLQSYVRAGSVDEFVGKTGVAHFLEHLAFKGTRTIGTRDYQAEEPLLQAMDALQAQIQDAKAAKNTDRVAQLKTAFEEIQTKAETYVEQNAFSQIVEQAGGVGLNATTSADATRYFYSLPANKLELWMSLESDRFMDPVFRGFYKEKDVILEERRLRVDNSPVGQMANTMLETAFQVHPYRRPIIGYEADLQRLTRKDVQEFFETYYTPRHLTMAVVGDVDPKEVRSLAQLYFDRFPEKQNAIPPIPEEPPQRLPREVTLELPSQPWYLEAYHRPSIRHPDDPVYQIIERLLEAGRLSRFYRSLVEEQQVALSVQGLNGFPGDQYPSLLIFYALTAPDRTLDEVAIALGQELERLKTESVTPEELERVKAQVRARLLRSLQSNAGMASVLAEYEAKTGSWRNMFREVEAIAAVTAADVQRVAQATFTPNNRTVGRIVPSVSP